MQQTITIRQDALPVVTKGLELKRSSLALSLSRYCDRLREFEARYGMSSDQFVAAFESGELEDDASWFEWEFVLDACREATRQLNHLHGLQ